MRATNSSGLVGHPLLDSCLGDRERGCLDLHRQNPDGLAVLGQLVWRWKTAPLAHLLLLLTERRFAAAGRRVLVTFPAAWRKPELDGADERLRFAQNVTLHR